MTKADLIKKISDQTGLENEKIKSIIETFYDVIIKSMSKKKNIFLRSFGTFYIQKREEKAARDIRRNKTVIIPTCYKPKFRPSDKFVDLIKNSVK